MMHENININNMVVLSLDMAVQKMEERESGETGEWKNGRAGGLESWRAGALQPVHILHYIYRERYIHMDDSDAILIPICAFLLILMLQALSLYKAGDTQIS